MPEVNNIKVLCFKSEKGQECLKRKDKCHMQKGPTSPGTVAHTYNPSTGVAEEGGSQNALGQSGLYMENSKPARTTQ